jgi:hypothetical protein
MLTRAQVRIAAKQQQQVPAMDPHMPMQRDLPKPLKSPAVFDGTDHDYDLFSFLERFNSASRSASWTDNEQVRAIGNYLSDIPLHVYEVSQNLTFVCCYVSVLRSFICCGVLLM